MAELNEILLTGQDLTEDETPPPEADASAEAPPPEPQKSQETPPLETQKPAPEVDDFSDLIDGVEEAAPVEAAPTPTTTAAEDPDLDRFLDGDDLSNLFDDDTQSV